MTVPATIKPSETQRAKENLAAPVQDALDEKKKLHLVAAKISEMNWGKGLSNDMQRAVAMYCRQNLLDPTEINVLGGNIYRNAAYYLRRLSEMLDDGHVEYAKLDHVHHDKRLETMAARGKAWDGATEEERKEWEQGARDARREMERRLQERIALNIPDAAVAAVVFRVKLKGMAVEFTGAKWCGGGTRKSDPVGDAFPVETAETRAVRRCMRFIASQLPHLKWREDELDDRATEISARIVDEREAAKIANARGPQIADHYLKGPALLGQATGFEYQDQPILEGGEIVGASAPASDPAPAAEPPKADEFIDDRDLIDEERRGAPPGSKRVDMPKPGAVQDAFPLGDEKPRRGRDALREG